MAQHSTARHSTAWHGTAQHSTACAARTAHLGTSATSTSEELFAWASTEIGPSTLEVAGQVAVKLVAFSRVVPFCISWAASKVPGTLPQIPGLPGSITLFIRKHISMPSMLCVTEYSSSIQHQPVTDVHSACTSRLYVTGKHGVNGMVFATLMKQRLKLFLHVFHNFAILGMQLENMSGSGRHGK